MSMGDQQKQQQQHSVAANSSNSNQTHVDGGAATTTNHQYTPPNVNDFPPLTIPSSTSIIIAEESAEASTSMDLYRGEVSCVGDDHALISKAAPSWLLSFLLYVSYYYHFFGWMGNGSWRFVFADLYISIIFFNLTEQDTKQGNSQIDVYSETSSRHSITGIAWRVSHTAFQK